MLFSDGGEQIYGAGCVRWWRWQRNGGEQQRGRTEVKRKKRREGRKIRKKTKKKKNGSLYFYLVFRMLIYFEIYN